MDGFDLKAAFLKAFHPCFFRMKMENSYGVDTKVKDVS